MSNPLLELGRVALGAMPLSTSGRPDRDTAIATVHAALDADVRLVDTADAYCLDAADTGHNEELVAEGLRSWQGPRDTVMVATKGGHVRDERGRWLVDGTRAHILEAAQRSRDRLGVDSIELYQWHRPDPWVPLEESMEAIAQLLADGVIVRAGVSNLDVSQLERAIRIAPIVSVQNELSPYEPGSWDVVRWCEEHDIAFLAWAPLGGAGRAASVGGDPTTSAFGEVAARHGVSPQRVVIAWLIASSPVLVPIVGSRRSETILDSIAATSLQLSDDDLRTCPQVR
jgi:aryl-alcohol dehydrogenase-like predicted oxidoreductase